MQAVVREKVSFQQFMDINNTGSLGRWALEQQRGMDIYKRACEIFDGKSKKIQALTPHDQQSTDKRCPI